MRWVLLDNGDYCGDVVRRLKGGFFLLQLSWTSLSAFLLLLLLVSLPSSSIFCTLLSEFAVLSLLCRRPVRQLFFSFFFNSNILRFVRAGTVV